MLTRWVLAGLATPLVWLGLFGRALVAPIGSEDGPPHDGARRGRAFRHANRAAAAWLRSASGWDLAEPCCQAHAAGGPAGGV